MTEPSKELDEIQVKIKEAVRDGLSNHTGEFANSWIFKGNYSHELLADILNDIMASERLFKNITDLFNSQLLLLIKRIEDEVIGEDDTEVRGTTQSPLNPSYWTRKTKNRNELRATQRQALKKIVEELGKE